MHPKSYKSGDHLVICDSCGAQRYRSECKYTWDGYLMCTTRNCWYPKEAIFETPPVINDPQALFDVRPDQASDDAVFVDDIVGLITTFGGPQRGPGVIDGRVTFGTWHVKFGHVDDPINPIE